MALRQGLIASLCAALGGASALSPAMAQTPQATQLAAPQATPLATPLAQPKPAPRQLAATTTKAWVPSTGPRTLAEAFAASYSNNPALQASRAQLRSVDENVPQALAGWRPTVVLSGTGGVGDGYSRQYIPAAEGPLGLGTGRSSNQRTDRLLATASATVTQPLYRGGRTRATTNRAENQVMGQRAQLIAQEQQTFTDTVNAYVGVIQNQQILALNINNEQVLARQLQATNDRFRVGEITRTDVAQAEAALAGATAQRETSEGNLATARATYLRVIGFLPPADLIEPQPLKLPVRNQQEIITLAAANNPLVVSAQFNDSAARDAIDVAMSQLLPQLSVQGQTFQQSNSTLPRSNNSGAQLVATLSVPLYQGGSEYSAVRQARQQQQQTRKQLDDARRQAIQQSTQAWETLITARATAASTQAQIRANSIALEGVEREAIVGSRTTLDVLNAQQALLNSQVTLVQNLVNVITASYSVASSIGRLTARDMNLPVPLYDETAYYNAVRDRWSGTGDYATDQPGR